MDDRWNTMLELCLLYTSGSPYIQKHCLVDWYSSGADSLGPTQQAVIQAVPVEGSGDTKTCLLYTSRCV